MKALLAVMLIGALGCGARMLVYNFFANRYGASFPIGTLVVNVSGCLIIGFFAALTRSEGGIVVSPLIRQAMMVGFLGGFTTFSAFGLQTLALWENGQWGYAALNILLSVALCLIAVWLGQVLALELTKG